MPWLLQAGHLAVASAHRNLRRAARCEIALMSFPSARAYGHAPALPAVAKMAWIQ